MKKIAKPTLKKPVAKDLPAKRSPKGGELASLANATNLTTSLSSSMHDMAKGIIANIRA